MKAFFINVISVTSLGTGERGVDVAAHRGNADGNGGETVCEGVGVRVSTITAYPREGRLKRRQVVVRPDQWRQRRRVRMD